MKLQKSLKPEEIQEIIIKCDYFDHIYVLNLLNFFENSCFSDGKSIQWKIFLNYFVLFSKNSKTSIFLKGIQLWHNRALAKIRGFSHKSRA